MYGGVDFVSVNTSMRKRGTGWYWVDAFFFTLGCRLLGPRGPMRARPIGARPTRARPIRARTIRAHGGL